MHFDLNGKDGSHAYKLLSSVVVPRPIALVTTIDPNGVVNAAPFSFFNLMGSDPPILAFNVGNRNRATPKDTRANAVRSGEFVVNLVHEEILDAMNICAIDYPHGVSETIQAGFHLAPSVKVSTPRIADSRVNIECRLERDLQIGNNHMLIGEILELHIADEFVDLGKMRVDTPAIGLIGRMHGGGGYCRTADWFDLPRLGYDQRPPDKLG